MSRPSAADLGVHLWLKDQRSHTSCVGLHKIILSETARTSCTARPPGQPTQPLPLPQKGAPSLTRSLLHACDGALRRVKGGVNLLAWLRTYTSGLTAIAAPTLSHTHRQPEAVAVSPPLQEHTDARLHACGGILRRVKTDAHLSACPRVHTPGLVADAAPMPSQTHRQPRTVAEPPPLHEHTDARACACTCAVPGAAHGRAACVHTAPWSNVQTRTNMVCDDTPHTRIERRTCNTWTLVRACRNHVVWRDISGSTTIRSSTRGEGHVATQRDVSCACAGVDVVQLRGSNVMIARMITDERHALRPLTTRPLQLNYTTTRANPHATSTRTHDLRLEQADHVYTRAVQADVNGYSCRLLAHKYRTGNQLARHDTSNVTTYSVSTCRQITYKLSLRHMEIFTRLRVATRGEAEHPGPFSQEPNTPLGRGHMPYTVQSRVVSSCKRLLRIRTYMKKICNPTQKTKDEKFTSTRANPRSSTSTRDHDTRIAAAASRDKQTLYLAHCQHEMFRQQTLPQYSTAMRAAYETTVCNSHTAKLVLCAMERTAQRNTCTEWRRALHILHLRTLIQQTRTARTRIPQEVLIWARLLRLRARLKQKTTSHTNTPTRPQRPRPPTQRRSLSLMTMCKRAKETLLNWIGWTNGEADNPGPAAFHIQHGKRLDRTRQGKHHNVPAHVNDVRYRFHNVQGLRDSRFRKFYLHRARSTCEILALAETNCYSDEEGVRWAKDWLGNAGSFWAPSPPPREGQSGGTCRGMAILFASSLGAIHARELWRDSQGRGLAVKAKIHGHDTVIVAFHADCHTQAGQAASYESLRAHVPILKNHHYIWMLDANNVVNLTKDAKRSDGARVQRTHVSGISAMHRCATEWGCLRDAYRSLNPGGTEYTRRQVDQRDPVNRANDQISWRRLDRIYVPPSLLQNQHIPRAKHVRHIEPSDTDMLALRRTGSTSKWSDHSAVQLTMQYTGTTRQTPRWSTPRHLLRDPTFVNNELRRLARTRDSSQWTASHDIRRILGRTRCYMRRKVWQETRRRGMRTELLRKWLTEVDNAIGNDKGQVGFMDQIPDSEPMKAARMAHFKHRRTEMEDELMALIGEKQRHWLQDRNFDEYTTGETCSRAFFEDARQARVYSHIDHVRRPNGQKVSSTNRILKAARSHFAGPGAIFNLNQSGHLTHAQQIARAHLLTAIREDGKILSEEQKSSLSLERIFSPETVQTAVDELQVNTAPGLDGWTAEYFRTVAQRVEDEDGERGPSPLSHLMADAFQECAQKGKLLPEMRTSVVSLIYKEKGLRNDLSKYRPIAVNTIASSTESWQKLWSSA